MRTFYQAHKREAYHTLAPTRPALLNEIVTGLCVESRCSLPPMARIALQVDDAPTALTLKALLEAAGHTITTGEVGTDLTIADSTDRALGALSQGPALVLAKLNDVPEALESMRAGVYGYILLPFQPGEARLMVDRALTAAVDPGPNPSAAVEMVSLEEIETRHILAVLRECKFNQARTARVLGIGRNTLWRKLKKIEHAKEATGDAAPRG